MCAKQEPATSVQLTLFVEASPVRISVWPERVQAWLEAALGCGSSTPVLLANFDHESSSWRTSPPSPGEASTPFSARWPTSGMMQSGRLYALPMLALRTEGKGSLSWPTPDAAVFNDGQTVQAWMERKEREKAKGYNGNGGGTPLAMAVRLPQWPTPTVQDVNASGSAGYSTESGRHSGTALTDAAVRGMWATPQAFDNGGARSPEALARAKKKGGCSNLREQVPGKLNPDWVEHLMGFPPGWTDGLPVPVKSRRTGKRHASSVPTTPDPVVQEASTSATEQPDSKPSAMRSSRRSQKPSAGSSED